MGLKKEAQTILRKPFQQKSENILAATGLKVLIAIGFLAAFWLLRSYSVELCLQNLQQETQAAKREIYRQVSWKYWRTLSSRQDGRILCGQRRF